MQSGGGKEMTVQLTGSNRLWRGTHKNTREHGSYWIMSCYSTQTSGHFYYSAFPFLLAETFSLTQRAVPYELLHQGSCTVCPEAFWYGQICLFSHAVRLLRVGPSYLHLRSCAWSVGGHATGNVDVSDEMLWYLSHNHYESCNTLLDAEWVFFPQQWEGLWQAQMSHDLYADQNRMK